jgi:hypothetical protein
VFLCTSASYYYFLEERQEFKKPEFVTQKIDQSFTNDFERYHGWENESRISEKVAHSGSKSNYIDVSHGRSAIFSHVLTTDELQNDSSVQASIWFYGPQPDITALVISFETKNKVVLKNDMRIRKFADHNYSWNRVYFQEAIPTGLPTGSVLKVYVDNKYNSDLIYLDDLEVDFIKK